MRRRIVAALVGHGHAHVRAIAQELCATSCERVAITLGPSAGLIAHALDGVPLVTLPNVLWSEGAAAAIRCAVAWALRSGADGLLLVDGEHAVERAHVERLLAAFRPAHVPIASTARGEICLPAVFGLESFARLGSLTGDADARTILRTTPNVKAVPVHVPEVPTTIPDVPADAAVLDPIAPRDKLAMPVILPPR
jgi:CTP:molybdopterin cytidylyltransferase MocA